MAEKSFFQERMDLLGISPEINKISLKNPAGKKYDREIFTEDEHGNIKILVYTLDRKTVEYDHPDANPERPNINNNRTQTFFITRLKDPIVTTDPKTKKTKTKKYDIPKGAGTYPFFPPHLVDKFQKKTKIKTLILTEGYFKAFKAAIHGADVVGLSSITHIRDKETRQLYFDIQRLIKECAVENIVILYDGDCRDISTPSLMAGEDLYTRPHQFYSMAEKSRDLLKHENLTIFFAHVNSDAYGDLPKGLDDLLISGSEDVNDIIQALNQPGKPSRYFYSTNITTSMSKVVSHFCFNPVEKFYELHHEKIKTGEFVYKGTTYRYNDQEEKCDIIVPAAASNFFRVGDDYFKFVYVPNKYKQLERQFQRRNKTTILDDHGKKFLEHIPKYEAFCNVPDHENFSQVINNCFNIYHQFEHSPEDNGTPVQSLKFVRHIFQEHFELGLDYLQILYQQPTQILPILSLVSRENGTGKTTFIKWLKAIFTQNCTVIGNDELGNAFNALYASKLIICCEESFIDKKPVIEKIKSLSTADRIPMQRKGKDHEEIDFFGKIILNSNNEDSFVYASSDDIRYWVRKVPVPVKENVTLLKDLIDEIPSFLFYLNNRKLSTAYESRMWFRKDLIRTEALQRLIQNSMPVLEKEIRSAIRKMFIDFNMDPIMLPIEYISKNLLEKGFKESQIRDILEKRIKVDRYRNHNGNYDSIKVQIPEFDAEGQIHERGLRCRPYIFNRSDFFTDEEIQQYESFKTTLRTQDNEHSTDMPF